MVKRRKKDKTKDPDIWEFEKRWKRALADYENLERRSLREIEEKVRLANEKLLRELLPILDNLEKAHKHLKDDGLSMILRDFKGVFEKEGVSEILVGEKFDPAYCEAVDVVKGEEDGKIVEVLEKGYRMGEKVIRTAKVRIIKKDVGKDFEKVKKASTFGDYA